MITHTADSKRKISKDYGDVKIRLSSREGHIKAWVDINNGSRWIYNCTLSAKGERFFINPPTIFNKDLVGLTSITHKDYTHNGWVVLNEFKSADEKSKCFKKAIAAYYKAVSSL